MEHLSGVVALLVPCSPRNGSMHSRSYGFEFYVTERVLLEVYQIEEVRKFIHRGKKPRKSPMLAVRSLLLGEWATMSSVVSTIEPSVFVRCLEQLLMPVLTYLCGRGGL